ncbi:MAG TPA: sigma 54-interacting transcriptional regulator, partial [Thermoanaerobaculia bacterium]|nr:sigma 54-interacting transcriptional regulator [Thermoanaerobaculia bacterium]
MRVLLTAPPDVDLEAVATALAAYDLDPVPVPLAALEGGPPEGLGRAVLILPLQGLIALGPRVEDVRRCLGGEVPLLVCCPQLKPADRQRLLRCGASSLANPARWVPSAIAIRILAELIEWREIEPAAFGTLYGATTPMRELYGDITTFAPLAEPVLILGETGTGKELVARELHRESGRPGSLMAINCAALTPELLESELFGHERGAFSGAQSTRKGLLAEAGAGTVFLDEIGELPTPAQAKLLRVLEERKLRPVGSNHWHPVHARILLATHRDLEEASRDGSFRRDLYERIRGFTLQLPPLRERLADLALLAHHFVDEYNQKYPGARTLPDEALDPLFRHDWPGNVRELRQLLWRAAAATTDGPISALRLIDAVQRRQARPGAGFAFDPKTDSWRNVHDRVRAQYFQAVLQEVGGNKELAAKRAGLSRSQFYEILKQMNPADRDPSKL